MQLGPDRSRCRSVRPGGPRPGSGRPPAARAGEASPGSGRPRAARRTTSHRRRRSSGRRCTGRTRCPTNLQSVKSASKNEQPLNVQFRKAASVCRDRLNRQSRNVHSVKTAPSSVASVRSSADEGDPRVLLTGEVLAVPVGAATSVSVEGARRQLSPARRGWPPEPRPVPARVHARLAAATRVHAVPAASGPHLSSECAGPRERRPSGRRPRGQVHQQVPASCSIRPRSCGRRCALPSNDAAPRGVATESPTAGYSGPASPAGGEVGYRPRRVCTQGVLQLGHPRPLWSPSPVHGSGRELVRDRPAVGLDAAWPETTLARPQRAPTQAADRARRGRSRPS